MSMKSLGIVDWGASTDSEGNRNYKAKFLLKSNSLSDGPLSAMQAVGVPRTGSRWSQGNETDIWAFCLPTMTVAPLYKKESTYYWTVERNFSTKPQNRCQDDEIENPLEEPPTLSGSFVNYTKEVTKDKDGNAVKTSSHEVLRGDLVTFDHNRAQVSIGLNVLTLPLATFTSMVDTVNDSTLWGLGSRKIKLSNVSWTRNMYGTCTFYYTINYEFDIRFDTFDTKPLDEGSKVLMAGGDANNPSHFKPYIDPATGNAARVFLDGNGSPLQGSTPVEIDVKYYQESNFLLLGIPSQL